MNKNLWTLKPLEETDRGLVIKDMHGNNVCVTDFKPDWDSEDVLHKGPSHEHAQRIVDCINACIVDDKPLKNPQQVVAILVDALRYIYNGATNDQSNTDAPPWHRLDVVRAIVKSAFEKTGIDPAQLPPPVVINTKEE